MNELKDSGERRAFTTGAVRDIADGKGRCDLLPLDTLSIWLSCAPLQYINDYVRYGDPGSLYHAIDNFILAMENKAGNKISKATVTLSVSKHFERGAAKYGERNWEQGIPVHCYIDSGVRHLLKVLDDRHDEPHEDAFVWNMLCAIWTHEHYPELIDLPFTGRRDTRDEPANRRNYPTARNTECGTPVNGRAE